MSVLSTQPLVSVILPSFNRAALLREALGSVYRQDHTTLQVIVVDDGSTDETAAMVREFPAVEYMHQPNAGPSAARNLGLRAARGEFVAFLDTDDLWDNDFLSRSIRCLRADATLAFTVANWRGVDATGAVVTYADKFALFRKHIFTYGRENADGWRIMAHDEARALFVRHSAAPPSATVIRRELTGHGWDPVARVGEDRLFFFTALMNSGLGAACGTVPRWSHRAHSGNEYFLRQSVLVIERDVYVKRRMLAQFGADLPWAERKILRGGLAESYFDLAYATGKAQQWPKALCAFLCFLWHDPAFAAKRLLSRRRETKDMHE